jgi:pimeloyl-ACP methyl ester carboxylesterase
MKLSDLSVTHHHYDLPNLRMHTVQKGEGPTVLLLHGFPETWWSWRYQIDPLVKAGFRVVAPDQRGYGETGKDGPYDLDTLTQDVCHLIEALGEKARGVRVVGHDWGGAVAWHLASFRPQYCRRVAIANCPHPAIMRQALLNSLSWEQLKRSWYMFFFLIPLWPEYALTKNQAARLPRILKANSVQRAHWTDDDIRPLQDALLRPGAARAMIGWYRASVGSGLRRPFSPPRYPKLECETLLLWGRDDPALDPKILVPGTDAYAPKLAYVEVDEAGHFPHSERPELVNHHVIQFLNRPN